MTERDKKIMPLMMGGKECDLDTKVRVVSKRAYHSVLKHLDRAIEIEDVQYYVKKAYSEKGHTSYRCMFGYAFDKLAAKDEFRLQNAHKTNAQYFSINDALDKEDIDIQYTQELHLELDLLDSRCLKIQKKRCKRKSAKQSFIPIAITKLIREGYTLDEVAAMLKKSPAWVDRAIKQLKDLYKSYNK